MTSLLCLHGRRRRRFRPVDVGSPDSEHLQGQETQVRWIQKHVAPPKTLGLVRQAPQPLEPESTSDGRRLWKMPCEIVEGCSDGNKGHRHEIPHLVAEDFLPRTAETDENQARVGIHNPTRKRPALAQRHRAELRRFAPRDDEPGNAASHPGGQRRHDLLVTPIEIDRETLRSCSIEHAESQVCAPDLLLQPCSVQNVQRPANRLSVRRCEIEVIEAVALVGVDDAGHHSVDSQLRDTERVSLPSR